MAAGAGLTNDCGGRDTGRCEAQRLHQQDTEAGGRRQRDEVSAVRSAGTTCPPRVWGLSHVSRLAPPSPPQVHTWAPELLDRTLKHSVQFGRPSDSCLHSDAFRIGDGRSQVAGQRAVKPMAAAATTAYQHRDQQRSKVFMQARISLAPAQARPYRGMGFRCGRRRIRCRCQGSRRHGRPMRCASSVPRMGERERNALQRAPASTQLRRKSISVLASSPSWEEHANHEPGRTRQTRAALGTATPWLF